MLSALLYSVLLYYLRFSFLFDLQVLSCHLWMIPRSKQSSTSEDIMSLVWTSIPRRTVRYFNLLLSILSSLLFYFLVFPFCFVLSRIVFICIFFWCTFLYSSLFYFSSPLSSCHLSHLSLSSFHTTFLFPPSTLPYSFLSYNTSLFPPSTLSYSFLILFFLYLPLILSFLFLFISQTITFVVLVLVVTTTRTIDHHLKMGTAAFTVQDPGSSVMMKL